DPPKPLTETDIWFQIGNVHELSSDYALAKDAYERVLRENPQHTKVLQQLGALYFRPNTNLSNIDAAVQLLTSAIELDKDKAEAQTWYLLGRCYMVQQHYNKAYEAYQQAVYRDGNNANYWCSIGVLYYQINQYRDALDAYSRAIRINPYLSEVWFDLGALYEACNNQVNDAIDAYTRAAELDRSNMIIEQRLDLLRRIQSSGQASLGSANPPPPPIDPPTTTATAGQPNAPGGPAGEAVVAGGVPGVLGAPPMPGAHPQEHAQDGQPGAPAAARAAQPYGHMARPMHAQPHHQSQGPAARPGYADNAGPSRYDPSARGEGPGADMPPPPHYASSGPPAGGPYAPQGAYAGGPDMHPSAPHHQPASRPYSTAGHAPAPEAYGPPGHPLPVGPHRHEGGMADSTYQSPVAQRHHQQAAMLAAHPQSTLAAESRHSPATFQQGPMNGYPQQHHAPDARHRSRSPSTARKGVDYRRSSTTQPVDPAGRPELATDAGSAGHAAPEYARQNSMPSGPLPLRKSLHPGDGDGDVQMADAQRPSHRADSSHEGSALAPPAAVSARGDESSTLPPLAGPTLYADATAASSTAGLSGPTAAPIRLPPVQFGSGIASPGGRSSPLAATAGSASRTAAPGSVGARLGDSGAPVSLASAISAADEDKEGSAINSLMSLSGVASTLTARPHQPPSMSASPQPSRPAAKSGSESAATAVGREQSTDAPAVTNGVKEMEISSPQGESAD
ncbi:glucose repression mediator protein, partial [Coemansia helicoidea]